MDPPATSCPFCDVSADRVLFANGTALAVRDACPVSQGHTLVISKRHIPDWWAAMEDERLSIVAMIDDVKHDLEQRYAPTGFNVGFNAGRSAGQTVFHLHVHVIPRYAGDVADPRGGVRNVIPGRGNYLADEQDPAGQETSAIEAPLEQAIDAASLIQRVLALVDEGRRVATYKPALLLALVELAVERVDGSQPLTLPVDDIADRVIELYWPQTRIHLASGRLLKQASTKNSRILGALTELRERAAARPGTPLSAVRLSAPAAYESTRRAVAEALAKQPIPRLQRPGSGSGSGSYPRFLYDDSGFVSERGWVHSGQQPTVVLAAGVAEALARAAPLLRTTAQDIWLADVVKLNEVAAEEAELRRFLFGADRSDLSPICDGLRDAGTTSCFWCEKPLPRVPQVDHVIPWSHYPSDDLFNLVLTDPQCNNDKRDRLVTAQFIERWLTRDTKLLRDLAAETLWPFEAARSKRVARSAYRYLPDGVPIWAGYRSVRLFDNAQRASVARALDPLSA